MGRSVLTLIVAFAAGSFLGFFVLGEFRPIMARLDWLPGGRWTVTLICGFVGSAIAVTNELKRLVRQRSLRNAANRLSLTFFPRGSEHVVEEMRSLLAPSGSLWINNEIRGRVGNASMIVGDLSHRASDDNSKTTVRTVAFFRGGDFHFPHFTMQSEGKLVNFCGQLMGIEDLDFPSHPKFSASYHLSSEQPETTRQLFVDEILAHFDEDEGWQIRADGSRILMTREVLISADDLDLFIDQAKGMLSMFESALQQLLASAEGTTLPNVAGDNTSEPGSRHFPGTSSGQTSQQQGRRGNGPSDRSSKSWLARRVEANSVAWNDVEEFIRRPAPRDIPPVIRRQRVGCNGLFLIVWLCLVELMVAFIFLLAVFSIEQVSYGLLIVLGSVMLGAALGIIWLVESRRKKIAILRNGMLVSGEIVGVDRTGWEVNSQSQFAVGVRYFFNGKPHFKKINVYGAHGDLAWDAYESSEPTPLLVDPNDADHSVLGIQMTNSVRLRL